MGKNFFKSAVSVNNSVIDTVVASGEGKGTLSHYFNYKLPLLYCGSRQLWDPGCITNITLHMTGTFTYQAWACSGPCNQSYWEAGV